jgi:hypothetical protein
MEQVLDVYQRPYDAKQPVVCMDESSKQLLSDVRAPLVLRSGQPRKEDSHYRRQGVWNLFVAFEPAGGKREVTVTARRTTEDWAHL